MPQSIRDFVAATGIVDVHEHHIPEILPDESRMRIGGDNWDVEETYGTLKLARQLIGEVLEEKLAAGYFREKDARWLAAKILRENALGFFKLN